MGERPQLIADIVQDHMKSFVPERPGEMERMEKRAAEEKFPIIGPAAGYMCYQLARMTGAKRIFELGSGFGYSTAWFARAVRENGGGEVHHVVWDEKLSRDAREHLGRLGYDDIVRFHVGEAVETLRATDGPFDLMFNDIDKEGYPGAMEAITPKLRPGGLLIVDNLLWGGRIFDEENREASTEGVRELTRLVTADPQWIATLVPVRDGLLLAYRADR
jgi:predicted O-methyltransferase YrrM